MKKYGSYKDSGVEWIGEIPSHWEKKRLKHVSKSTNGYSFKSDDFDKEFDVPVIRIGDVGDIIDFEDCVKVKSHFLDDRKEFQIYKNDILIGLTGGTIGKSGRYNYDSPSLLNQRVGLLRNKDSVLNGLLYHYVKSEVFIRYIFFDCYGGGQDNISMSDILNMVFPSPPLSEQSQIVQFLDEKTSLIDSLIEKTKRKIELLKEERTSLINHTVTKGLNPNVEMKDSGVEWIGEIPSHWGNGKLYQYSEMSNGSTPSRIKPEYWESGTIPWMSSGEINKKRIREIDGRITQEGFENSSTKILPVGTVMMGLNGQGKTKGTVGILEIETTCNQSLCGMIFNDNIYPMFSYYFLDSQYCHIRGLVGEGQREGISVSFLGRYPLVVPSLSEQEEIVQFLDEKTSTIDKTIELEGKRIDYLKEYRQSLISEVVTGKIKVITDE